MSGEEVGLLSIALMLLCIYFGMHIAVALLLVSLISVAILKDPFLAARMMAAAANDALQEYLFGVVPLFVLMGLLVSVSGVGRDTFDVFEWMLRRIKGGLGVATVAANAVFAAVTGISIASASVFTKVATPEMMRHGYTPAFSVGVVAGSSVLGMLIPPSLLMIVYATVAETSVGKMFIAGIIPGIVLAVAFSLMIVALAVLWPRYIGSARTAGAERIESIGSASRKGVPILALIVLVLGGIYTGAFTPTEAGAVGALGALIIALMRRSVSLRRFWLMSVETGHVSVSVLLLVLAASLYSRMLALSGLPASIATLLSESGLGAYGFLTVYIVVVLLLGCLIDSISIMLILLPIVLPVATSFGMDLIWFGVVTVVAVEIGLITPPFGISVFAVKASLDDQSISLQDIFRGSLPFVLCMTATLIVLVMFPGLSTWLVN
jgi:tripartite ATP-independent transporter DctM subunit